VPKQAAFKQRKAISCLLLPHDDDDSLKLRLPRREKRPDLADDVIKIGTFAILTILVMRLLSGCLC